MAAPNVGPILEYFRGGSNASDATFETLDTLVTPEVPACANSGHRDRLKSRSNDFVA